MIGRRALLRAMAALGASGLARGAGLALPGCGRDDALLRALRDFFADREAARAVGAEILALDPELSSPRVLVDRIVRRRGPEWSALAERDPERLAEALRAQHRADFADDRVVAVRGWVLSQTEACLLAFAALGG